MLHGGKKGATDEVNKPHTGRLVFRRAQKEERKQEDLSWRQLISAVSIVKQSKNGEMSFPCSFIMHFANGHLEICKTVCFD